MKRFIYLFLVITALGISQSAGYAQSISVTSIRPGYPANLKLNQKAYITFEYTSRIVKGIRIFVRPITKGVLSPNYAASGSPIYKYGKGDGRASFTITKGNVVVDQLRFQIYTADQKRMLFEFLIPVKWTFGQKLAVYNYQLQLQPGKKYQVAGSETAPDTTKTSDGTDFKRFIKPDGSVEIHYPDGTIKTISPGGSITIYDPKTRKYMNMSMLQVQPASPPEFYSDISSSVDNNWLSGLNGWIEYVGESLLQRIKYSVNDSASFESYQRFEDENTTNLYEKVDMRLEFLDRLGESNQQ